VPADNVELVRQLIAALNEGDVERYLSFCSEDVELVSPVAGLEGSNVGADGVRRFFEQLKEVAQTFRLTIESYREVSTGRVLAEGELAFVSARGIPVTQAIYNVYDLGDGKLIRVRAFLDREAALAAAGVTE
jgi:ketosteroid isomerase-like protein